MRKARFTEHQIISVLKSVEAGRTVKDVCREAGISEVLYYNWKAKYGGMEGSDIKKMFAYLSLEFRAMKVRYRKKTLKPAIRWEFVSYLTAHFVLSIRQASTTISLSRTGDFNQPDIRRDEPVLLALTEQAERYPRYGFKKLFQILRKQGTLPLRSTR